jgi:oxygen-dependent protoporphyrinogen oxidase
VSHLPRVAVVGGGIAGLAAAWKLLGRADVTVYELAARVGGKLAVTELSGVSGPVAVDAGSESVLARRPEALTLAREVGLGEDLVFPATADARVFTGGGLHRLPPGTVLGVPTRVDAPGMDGLFGPAELARIAAEPDLGPDGLTATLAAGGDVAIGELVGRRMGDAVVDRLVEPLLGGVYAGRARELSLQLTSPALAAALRTEPSLLRAAAAVAGLPVAATSASPVPAGTVPVGTVPAGPVPAGTGTPVFAGIRGGIGRLPVAVAEALAERGVAVRDSTAVRGLRRTPDGWALTVGPVPRERVEAFDAVVLAVPAPPAARLLGSVAPAASAELAGIAYASVALVHLAVPAAVGAGLAGSSGVLVPPVEGLTVKAATWSSLKWDWVREGAPDTLVLRASVGRAGDEADVARPDGELVDTVLADLSRLTGAGFDRAALVDARVTRWGGGLPQYPVEHAARVGRIRSALAGYPTLAVCGAAYDGVGIPACIASGRAAASALVLDLRP